MVETTDYYNIAITIMSCAWDVDIKTIEDTIKWYRIDRVKSKYDGETSEFHVDATIGMYVMYTITHNLQTFVNFYKLPYNNIRDRMEDYNHLNSRPDYKDLFKKLALYKYPLTQQKFEKLCELANYNKKTVTEAIISGKLMYVLIMDLDEEDEDLSHYLKL